MNLKEILAIPGKKGLYIMVSRGKSNVIVESLTDGSRMPLFASTQASALKDICIFTHDKDVFLKDVFKRIHEIENGNKAIDVSVSKPADIIAYMTKILPEYDSDRVHVSDMKKLFSWYNQLLEQNLLSLEDEGDEDEGDEEV